MCVGGRLPVAEECGCFLGWWEKVDLGLDPPCGRVDWLLAWQPPVLSRRLALRLLLVKPSQLGPRTIFLFSPIFIDENIYRIGSSRKLIYVFFFREIMICWYSLLPRVFLKFDDYNLKKKRIILFVFYRNLFPFRVNIAISWNCGAECWRIAPLPATTAAGTRTSPQTTFTRNRPILIPYTGYFFIIIWLLTYLTLNAERPVSTRSQLRATRPIKSRKIV